MSLARSHSRTLRLGFLPLTDAAPIVVARELGFFSRYGLEVELTREVGWATIREKIIYGELDAAHAPAPMLWSTRLGRDSVACPVLTAIILSTHGNTLTLSERLWTEGVRDLPSFREAAKRRSGERKLTLGVVFTHSSHHTLLRAWLLQAGLNPDRDVRIVVVPPAQMVRNLATGNIDGFVAGEPYGSVAVAQQVGWIAGLSAQLQPGAPEKVLMVTERLAFDRTEQHHGLVNALHEAAAWCDHPENREELIRLLARPAYVGQPAAILRRALSGKIEAGHGLTLDCPEALTFHRNQASIPTHARALALQRDLTEARLLPAGLDRDLPHRLFREDIFRQALTHALTEPLTPSP